MPSDVPVLSLNPFLDRRRLRLAGIVLILIALAAVIIGIVVRLLDNRRLREWTDAQAVPTVVVNLPATGKNVITLDLPGRLEAYARAPLYARVSGYLKSWKADIGTLVKAGQLLAEIETPDLDQQLLQAKADLVSAESAAALAATTAKRWQAMLGSDAVSRQEVDEKTGDLANKQAMVKAAQANVDRFQAMKGFTRIVAPFDGRVTARSTDVGALINAGSGVGPELFVVSDTRKLRVYVNVPQNYAPGIKPGGKAKVSVPEYPGKLYPATVESSAQAINAASGSMLVQLVVDNTAAELLSGGYAVISFDLPNAKPALSIPASALIFDKTGLRVATVDKADKIVLKPVTIARDMGKLIEIGSGLVAQDRVIESPPDGIVDGEPVHVALSETVRSKAKAAPETASHDKK
ncbi:RND transporter MFP subunit [Rugosibacter aromaticivorans]|uniref:RND transporter MFP subunit n=1 Tax=Rugosibacter aromaticivorans TaxID=1565605 RepID=A0A0C5J942_9PROT|nr:efflux RND transporter periplasmic adaptor subunit [Rugosibacter aromaticivorans]AJP48495.1 RND transporter MFP subunit [Rugosibacter aromaticivorans]